MRRVRPPARAAPAKVAALSLGPENVGDRVEDRAELGVAVAGPLDRLGVEPQRDVVDEHLAVHLGEVHDTLAAVDEGVEPPDDVVAIDSQVEGEVVAGPRRDAGIGKPELGGDRRDDRLRAVAARHGESVGAAIHGVPYERPQVVAALQLDRLEAALTRLVGEVELSSPCRRPTSD